MLVLFIVFSQPVVGADFKKGMDAYKLGDYATAFREWEPLAIQQDNLPAQNGLGMLYKYGLGVSQNYKIANAWYKIAANNGMGLAQYNLALSHANGLGIPKNYKIAIEWYKKAANNGVGLAQFNLANSYNHGKGVPQSYKIAIEWYKKAAEKGVIKSQHNLAFFYEKGLGVSQNYKIAIEWYKKAAKKGNVYSQNNLGWLHEKGIGVPRNYKIAIEWYKKAANNGYSRAQNNLGNLQKKIAQLEKDKKLPPTVTARKSPSPPPTKKTGFGSGLFVSRFGHAITNEHVVNRCKKVTIGKNAKKQFAASVLETDKRNDLALLRISNMKTASIETQSLTNKLGIAVVPLAAQGLLRFGEVELGENVLVAGFPFGDIFSDSIKVTRGIVSANRGFGDNTGQFQIDAAVQSGNSGGPIYDEYGNIIGVVVARLNKMKVQKVLGSIPENVNFGIKASTVRQFLTTSGLPTKWSKRSKAMSMRDLAKIAKNQTVMVVCHR